MATTYNHIRMSEVDSSGNVRVMYPETTGADVTISRSGNANIPSSVTTAQTLANALAASAFTNPISDSTTGTTTTWSSNKINTAVTNISVYVGSSDSKLHFVNSAGTDTALNFSSASGTATAAQVLTGYTFSSSSGKGLNGEMPNRGSVSTTIDNRSAYTVQAGYYSGGTITAQNYNSTTYTFAANSTGGTAANPIDMGSATHTYRYINASAVYNKGKADGATTHTGTYSVSSNTTYDMGSSHTYRYVSVSVSTTLSETLLWTNPSPTSTWAGTTGSSTQSATLNQSYTNFKYLKIYYRFSTTDSTQRNIIIAKDILQKSSTAQTFCIGMNSGSGNSRVRTGVAESNTSIKIWPAYQTVATSQTASNKYIIPVSIYGLN